MNKREEQRERRRAEIFDVAIDLFARRGYGSTKVTDIIADAKVSMGLLFHYFGTKENLYHEIVRVGCEHTNFPLPLEDSPIRTFSRVARNIFAFLESEPMAAKMFVLMTSALRDDGIPEKTKKLVSAVDVIARSMPLIEKGQRLGEIRLGDARTLSAAFWGAVAGIAQEIALDPTMPCPAPDWIVAILSNH